MCVCMLSKRDMADLAVTAMEGGISYWCSEFEYVERDDQGGWQVMSDERRQSFSSPAYDAEDFWEGDKRGIRLTTQYDEDSDVVLRPLTASSIRKAFKYQPPKNKYPSKNWFPKLCKLLHSSGDYDADDADTIVQIAVMDEVVYG